MESMGAMAPDKRVVKVKAWKEGRGMRESVSLMERPKRGKRGMLLAKRKKLAPRRMRRDSLRRLQIAAEALLGGKAFDPERIIMEGIASAMLRVREAHVECDGGVKKLRCVEKKEEAEAAEPVGARDGLSQGEEDIMAPDPERDAGLEIEQARKTLDDMRLAFESGNAKKMPKRFEDPNDAKHLSICSMGKLAKRICGLRQLYLLRLRKASSRSAAKQAGETLEMNAGAALRWKNDFVEGEGKLRPMREGKHERKGLLSQEDIKSRREELVALNADPKGRPSLTAEEFRKHLSARILPDLRSAPGGLQLLQNARIGDEISLPAAYRALKELGCNFTSVKKTGCCDGRCRGDAQKRKKQHAKAMKALQLHMPNWARMSPEALAARCPEEKPERWAAGESVVELRVDSMSCEEVEQLGHKLFGAWSLRQKPGIPSLGAHENGRLLLLSQDECALKANDDNAFAWRKDGVSNHRKKKAEGQGLMASGFVSECDGFLTLTEEELQEIEKERGERLEMTRSFATKLKMAGAAGCSLAARMHGKNQDGCWNNEKIMQRAKELLHCVSCRHRNDNAQALILLDWSSGHAAMGEGALVAGNMGLNPGGKQAVMRDAVILGHYPNANAPSLRAPGSAQKMALGLGEKPNHEPDMSCDCAGLPKGLRQALWERGLLHKDASLKGKADKDGLPAPNARAREIMAAQSDFQWETCALSACIASQSHVCLLAPKLHPELSFAERCWGRAKWLLRLFCDCAFPGLKVRAGEALGMQAMTGEHRKLRSRLSDKERRLSLSLIRKQARKPRDYVTACCRSDKKNVTADPMEKSPEPPANSRKNRGFRGIFS